GPNVCAQTPPLPQVERGGSPVRPAREGTGIPNAADLRRPVLSFRRRLIQDPLTRAHVRLLGPCFKTGRVEFTTRLRLHFQATRLQGDRIRIEPSSYGPRTHFGQQPRSRGLAAESVSGTLTPKRHISPRPCERGIRRWASPGSLAVTKGIPVGFFSSAYLYA
ncbi:hypothetical protein JTE90_005340, partial [Oedothorax gibbosus]